MISTYCILAEQVISSTHALLLKLSVFNDGKRPAATLDRMVLWRTQVLLMTRHEINELQNRDKVSPTPNWPKKWTHFYYIQVAISFKLCYFRRQEERKHPVGWWCVTDCKTQPDWDVRAWEVFPLEPVKHHHSWSLIDRTQKVKELGAWCTSHPTEDSR